MADLTAPGTHPQEAVDAVAQALHEASFTPNLYAQARALLDRITPLLIAAEREACAKVAETEMDSWVTIFPKEACLCIAAAIRERR